MANITTTASITAPAADLRAELFTAFVEYIDRGEKTTKTYLTNLRQFLAWLRYSGISHPTRQDVILYRDWLTAEHEAIRLDPAAADGWTYRTDGTGNRYTITCRASTVKQYLQAIRQFFSWTAAAGYYPNIAKNVHTPKIRSDQHKKDALTAADVLTIEQSIEAAADAKAQQAATATKDTAGRISRATEQGKRLAAMYLLAVNAGLRTVELSRANIRDIEVKHGRATIAIWGKGHDEPDQIKPLAPEVYEAIRDYLASRTDRPTASAPLFVATGNRSGGKRLAPTTISTMLKRAMQQAGYDSEKLTAHSLRHTCGNNIMELTGDNLFLTQQYMRHDNPRTTEIYLHRDTVAQEASTAQRLYDRYHGIETDDRQKLAAILDALTPEQLQQITGIAAAMAR